MSNLQIPNLILRDDNFPLLTETIISQQGIEKNSATIPFSKLIQLNTALDALQPIPPNNHTVLFEDTIQVQNVGATQNLEINNNQINIQGTGVNPTAVTIQGDFTPPNVSNLVITDNTQYYNASTKNQIVIGDLVNNTSINIDATTTTPSITMTDTINTGYFRNDFCQILNNSSNDYYSFNSNTLQVDTPSNPSYIAMNSYDGLKIQNDVKAGAPTSTTTLTHSSLSLDNIAGGGPKNTLSQGDMTINDNANILSSQITSDYVRFIDNSSSHQIELNNSGILANAQRNVIFDNGGLDNGHDLESKFVYRSGRVDRVEQLGYNGVNDHIEVWANHYVSDGVNPVMYSYVNYLSDLPAPNDIGWYCHITNFTGADITLSSEDGTEFFSHSSGGPSSTINIKKWATVRVTLIYSNANSHYYWAVMEF